MAATALSIIQRATQIARIPGQIPHAISDLNSLLAHICRTVDFSAARGQFNFTFATNLVTSGGGDIVTAAPNPLPMDYLRVGVSGGSTGSQRSSTWYIQGVPYDMIEVDLTEWDNQVMQAGTQSYPYLWAKDMSQLAVIAEPQGDLDTASTTVSNLTSIAGIRVGMSISGGVGPLSIIVPGTTIVGLGATSLTLSQRPQVPSGQAQIGLTQASLMIGYPPVGLPYPPPSGAFPVAIRYQRLMPKLTSVQVFSGAYPWFDDDMVLVDGLAGLMMRYSGDSRAAEYIGSGLQSGEGRFGKAMRQYLRLADDNANRAQSVQLDRRSFGSKFSLLRNTKKVGWLVPLTVALGGMVGF